MSHDESYLTIGAARRKLAMRPLWYPVTPFELNLENDLNLEVRRFQNEWLFKWHNINIDRQLVDVDRFDGGRIRLGGIKFEGQPQQIYWQAIGRYIAQKIRQTFNNWDAATRTYLKSVRIAALDRIELRLKSFAASILYHSRDTDRRLRGRGFPEKVSQLETAGFQHQAEIEIKSLADAHRQLIDASNVKAAQKIELWGFGKWIEDFYANNKGVIWFAGIVLSAILAIWHRYVS